MQETRAQFTKGINRRFSIERGDPDRLYTLQNARLQSRGNTTEVSRIEGYQEIAGDNTSFDKVYDSVIYQNQLIVLWYYRGSDTTIATPTITIIPLDGSGSRDITFNGDEVDYAELLLLEDTIFITPYDKLLVNTSGTWYLNDFVSTTPTFDISASTNGGLEQSTVYWYKVQYIYFDGHTTKTSYPKKIETDTTNQTVELSNIPVVEDLDGNNVDIRVFRKKEEGDWFSIDRITPDSNPYTFVDDGKPILRPFQPENYVWPKSSRTQEMVRDRLVRANNSYDDVENNAEFDVGLETGTIDNGEQGIPYNTDVELFSEVRTEDGTTTTFKFHGSVEVGNTDSKLQVKQTGQYDITGSNFQELALYARYRTKQANDVIPFNTFEVYNSNVPSIATSEETEANQERPVNPHVLLTWRYLTSRYVVDTSDNSAGNNTLMHVRDWNSDPDDPDKDVGNYVTLEDYSGGDPFLVLRFVLNSDTKTGVAVGDDVNINVKDVGEEVPAGQLLEFTGGGRLYLTQDVNIGDTEVHGNLYVAGVFDGESAYHVTHKDFENYELRRTSSDTIGQPLPFYKKYYQEDEIGGNYVYNYIYELAFYEALKEAIQQGKLYVRLSAFNTDEPVSTERRNDEFVNYDVQVVGLKETSNKYDDPYIDDGSITSSGFMYSPWHSAIYLILETDTPWDDFNNQEINNDNYGDYSIDSSGSPVPILSHTFEFELIGLDSVDNGINNEIDQTDYQQIDYDYRLKLTDYSDFDNDAGTLVHQSNDNTVDSSFNTLSIQGWEKTVNNKFEFFTLNPWNIYSNIITEEDIEDYDQNYTNQLVWSDSYIQESNVSKIRNFDFNNFKYISADFGEIQKIAYINNILLVFCEYGVNRVNVGEVLTQQTDSQVFVDSSQVLNNDVWILKNLPNVQANTVVQHENMLFFCDGKDVWQYTDQLKKISAGAIELDQTKDYVGAIDPKNKEYLLTNGDKTWAYSLEFGQWQGPYTFALETASVFSDNFYGVVDSKSVEFNTGNTFAGTSYDTVIESVANTLDEPSITKLFRKFKIETTPEQVTSGQVDFKYGKEYNNWTIKDLANTKLITGLRHIGINPDNKNARQIFWNVTTNMSGFVLSLVNFLWEVRRRR